MKKGVCGDTGDEQRGTQTHPVVILRDYNVTQRLMLLPFGSFFLVGFNIAAFTHSNS